MRKQMDTICTEAGIWPHAVLSGHAHNYQRYIRHRATGVPTKTADDDAVTFENYDDTDYGYLRVLVTSQQLRIEYHPASDGVSAKTADDSVTIDLATRKQVVYKSKDLGMPARSSAIRRLLALKLSR